VQAINSTVEILLIDNHQASSVLIERHLAQIRSDLMLRVTKIRDLDAVSNLIHSESLDIIFFIFNSANTSDLISLSRIKKANLQDLPIILIAPEINLDLTSLPINLDNYLILSDISPGLLERGIFFALKRFAQIREANSLKQENLELSSQLIKTKDLFQTIIDNTSTLVWMCDALGNTTWERVMFAMSTYTYCKRNDDCKPEAVK
jgi:DNA-binding NtrC family response regulator